MPATVLAVCHRPGATSGARGRTIDMSMTLEEGIAAGLVEAEEPADTSAIEANLKSLVDLAPPLDRDEAIDAIRKRARELGMT